MKPTAEVNPTGELPGHPSNLLRVRVRESARGKLLPSYLYYVFLHLFQTGQFKALQTGSVQQCITAKDVKQIPLKEEAPKSRRHRRARRRTLGQLVEVRSGVNAKDLQEGDILLQRVGTCGRPSIVLGTDPLSIRTDRGFNPARAAGMHPSQFAPDQLAEGTRVEMEHTDDPVVAQRIAMDHLAEHPDYYRALAQMELGLGVNPMPGPEDWNYYINFVLYAVVGRMGPADNLMREHGPAIRRVAEHLRDAQPWTPSKLYRGLLLDPGLVVKGRVKRERDPARTFWSFSEKEDVACWFADPASIISGFVARQHPTARPYLAKNKGGANARARMLWTHAWDTLRLPGGRHLRLLAAANAHPEIDEAQFLWNATTQAEVILEPAAGDTFKVTKLDPDECPDTDELDATYAYPPFLDHYLGR